MALKQTYAERPGRNLRFGDTEAFARTEAPLLSLRGTALALLISVLLCWPMLLVTAPLGFSDTVRYLQLGEKVVDRAVDFVLPQAPAPAETGTAGTGAKAKDTAKPSTGGPSRSFVYAAFLYVGSLLPGGLVTTVVAQTTATVLLLFAFVTVHPRPLAAAFGVIFLAAFTTLPWFASNAMPDILIATILLFYVLLASGIAHVGTGWRIAFAAIACFGLLSHYGNLPVAFALMVATLVCCVIRRTLSAAIVALAVLPLIVAVALNLGTSAATLDGPSLAPKRLPILLARSLEDGPAAWHLQEVCPEASYAICDIFPDGVPDGVQAFLWSKKGIFSVGNDQIAAIRAEEFTILWNAFKAYPVEQIMSLFGNFAKQLRKIGTEDIYPMHSSAESGQFETSKLMRPDYPSLEVFDTVTFWGTLAAVVTAGLAWAGGTLRQGASWALGLCVCGILINAMIFGGLSAPVDRYQSRVLWVFPALALVFWLDNRGLSARKTRT